MLYAGRRRSSGLLTLWNILGKAGLQGDTGLSVDGGDALSWPGNGQKWLDRSTNGADFYLGPTGSAEASDPVLVGTVGKLKNTTYFLLDGDAFWQYDGAIEAWMNAWHHDGAAFTLLALLYFAGGIDVQGPIFCTADQTANNQGISWAINASGKPFFYAYGSGAYVQNGPNTADDALSLNAWNMVALSFDEAAGAGGAFHYLNGVYNQVGGVDTFNATYSSPAAGTAAGPCIATWPAASSHRFLPNGTRLMGFAAIDKACSKVELDAVWKHARKRLGI